MPVYAYVCSECGHQEDQYRTISDRDTRAPCPKCGAAGGLGRDVVGSMRVNSTDQEYDRPIYSRALGVAPNQIEEAKRMFPHHEFAPDGRMILRSHAQRNRVMKELGFFDRDGYN